MKQYRVSDAARADLDDIWFYIAQHNVDAADKLIHAMVAIFSKLASMPHMGRNRSDLSAGLRSFVVARHVIFYLPTEDGIDVARVIHGARDFPPLFE